MGQWTNALAIGTGEVIWIFFSRLSFSFIFCVELGGGG